MSSTKLFDKDKGDDWYKFMCERYMPEFNYNLRQDFDEKVKLYRFFNGDISDYLVKINEMCNDAVSSQMSDDDILHYNKFRNKFNILEGDLIRRGNHHKMMLITAKAIQKKNEKLVTKLQENVEKDLQVVWQRGKEQLQSLPPEELQKWIEEQRQILTPRDLNYKNFLSDMEIYKSKMLKYIYQTQNILQKQLETLKDRFIMDEVYVYVTFLHGIPTSIIRNPLYINFHKSNNESSVEKSDWITYDDEITVGQFLDEYINVLEKEDIEKVINEATWHTPLSKDHLNKFIYNHSKFYDVLNKERGGRFMNYIGLNETEENTRNFYNARIKRTHLEFKAYKEVVFYTYMDEYNVPITVLLDSNSLIVPKDAQKLKYTNEYGVEDDQWVWSDEYGDTHKVVIKWIPRAYEVERLNSSVYVKKREVPNQPDYVNDPIGSFTLSTFGGVSNNRNAKVCSLMQNAMPYALQIVAVKALIDKETAKYRGFEIIQDIAQVPQDLAEDGDVAEDVITKVEAIARKTGVRWVDSSSSRLGLPNPQRGRAVDAIQLGSSAELINLNHLADLVDIELGIACGVSKAREGQMVSNSNVTDNQQSIVQTTLQTEPFYKKHAHDWAKILSKLLDNWDVYFKKYFEDNPDSENCFLEFIAEDGKELIEVKPEYLSTGDLGIFVVDGYNDKMYQDLMVQKLIQNTQDTPIDALSNILKNIASGMSAEETHRQIQLFQADQQKRQENMQKMELQMQQEAMKAQQDTLKYQSDLRIEEALAKHNITEQYNLDKVAIEAQRFKLAQDVDADGRADTIQLAEKEIEAEKEMQRIQIEANKELEDIKTKGKIAIEKAKPKTKTVTK